MAIIRQLPALYLRGSIANVTMANLTYEEQAHLSELLSYVSNHPEMARHKARVIKEFGVTIRSDYADDRRNAEQEFHIAVWRGLVSLFYHKDYVYQCASCQATSYLTKRGKAKPIERTYVPCPACRMAEVKDAGITELMKGQMVNHDEMQDKYKHLTYGSPQYVSCIKSIAGKKKYENPQAVIDCPKQLKHFFGEFVWNYFRQQIKENKRKERRKKSVLISGPADVMVIEQILHICQKLNIERNFNKIPVDGLYSIKVNCMQTSPDFSVEMAMIRASAIDYGINMKCTDTSIDIEVNPNAPTIEVSVIKPEHVTVIDNHANGSGEEEGSSPTVNQISYRTIGEERMDQDDHVATIDMTEAARKVRDSLPEGDCKSVYDIYSQVGSVYDKFSVSFGGTEPRINHVAEFLSITPRAVKQHRETIKIHCLAHDFTP